MIYDEMMTNLHTGRLSDSPPFRKFLERYFSQHQVQKDDRWYTRDNLSEAWNSAIDAALGLNPSREERIDRARKIDEWATKSGLA